jgi:class 3 adenylate cyclase/tetratricopeptide (TPR) repeat protein
VEDASGPALEPTGQPREAAYERRIVSVLFADLVGFTSLAEGLDPEDVAAIQDRYFATIRETVGRYGGVLEKFVGDAAMAAFGVPRARDDDAERAVRAGLAIASAVEHLTAPLGLDAGALAVRVGVATGEVAHASSGPDEGRLSGDTVNTAARLQTAAPPGRVLIGETTALAVAEAIELEPTRSIPLKGKAEPVRTALAVGVRAVRSRDAAMGDLRAPTLGRDAELDLLVGAAVATRRTGTNESWLVVAPPGVGKSRLLTDLAMRLTAGSVHGGASGVPGTPDASNPPTAVVTVRFRSGDGRPFGALADLASTIVGDRAPADLDADLRAGGLTCGRAEVVAARLVDLLLADTSASGVGGASSREETPDRDARFDAWLAGFAALTGDRPAIWLLEDVHWAGPDVLAFIRRAHATAAVSGRLVVATARPSLLEAESGWAAPQPGDSWRRIDLAPLPPATASDLIRALVGEALPPILIQRVAFTSDGNPLFIEELLRTWVSVGLLVRTGDGWLLTAHAPDVPVAPTVQAIYAAQLDDLPAESRRLTRQGSVAGRRVPADFLASLDGADATEALATLIRRALLDGPAAAPPLGDSYAYRHALLRDAGYASLARSERAVLHVRFARWVERLLVDRPDVGADWIGEHLEAAVLEAPALAGDVAPGLGREDASALAASWLERAAEAATRRAARDRATELFRRSLDLTPSIAVLDGARRERRLGETIADGGRFDEAAERLTSALERFRRYFADAGVGTATRRVARDGLAGTADSLARILLEQLRFEEGWTLAEAVLEEIGPADDLPSARLRLRAATGRNYFSDQPGDLLPAALAAVAIARRGGDQELELEASLASLVSLDAASEVVREAVPVQELAARLGRPDVVSRILRIRAMLGAAAGDDPFAMLDEAAEIAVSHGLDEALGWAEYARAEVALGLGLWDVALRAGLRAIDIGERHGYRRVVVRTWHVLCPVAGAREDLDLLRRAAAWYEAAEASLPGSPYGLMQYAGVHTIFGRLGVVSPRPVDPDELMPSFDLEVDLPSWIEAVDEVLRQWIADGRLDVVEEANRRMRASLERWPSLFGSAAVSLFQGRLALARGDLAAVARDGRAALEPLEAVHGRWWRARVLRLLERAGAATATELAEAAAIERELGVVGPAS